MGVDKVEQIRAITERSQATIATEFDPHKAELIRKAIDYALAHNISLHKTEQSHHRIGQEDVDLANELTSLSIGQLNKATLQIYQHQNPGRQQQHLSVKTATGEQDESPVLRNILGQDLLL